MFTIVDNLVVRRRVEIEVPTEGNGVDVQAFDVDFKLLNDDQAAALMGKPSHEHLAAVVVGWDERQVKEHDGSALVFSADALKRLGAIPYVRKALFKAYNIAIGLGASGN